ncbi:MAG: RNA 2',3'-cyclic phosphodiesterase [Thermoplasmatota archaeon]
MRLFVAVDIPHDPIFHRLHSELKGISRRLRPVDPANQHISLKFLGDPGVSQKKVIDVLKGIDIRGEEEALVTDRIGAFPSWKKASVLWIGFSGSGLLERLSAGIDEALHERIGTPRESRSFRPHITIARIKGRDAFETEEASAVMQRALDDLISKDYSIPLKGFHLYNSTLTPDGPVYRKIASFGIRTEE